MELAMFAMKAIMGYILGIMCVFSDGKWDKVIGIVVLIVLTILVICYGWLEIQRALIRGRF